MFYIRPSLIFKFTMNFRRPHQVLGISTTASIQQIKTAYYRLAKIHHPDVNPASINKFQEIQNAYEQLSKPSSIHNHSPYPSSNQNKHQRSKPQDPFSSRGARRPKANAQNTASQQWFQQSFDFGQEWPFQQQFHQGQKFASQDFQMDEEDFHEFEKAFNSFLRHGYLKKKYRKYQEYINQLFIKNSNRGNNFGEEDFHQFIYVKNKQKPKKSKSQKKMDKMDINIKLQVSSEDLGKQKVVEFEREVSCHRCTFQNEKNYLKKPCKYCHNSGLDDKLSTCRKCEGKGYHIKYDCKQCHNKGTTVKKVKQTIIIPQSIRINHKIVLKGRGRQSSKSGDFGNLIVTLIPETHEVRNRSSKNDPHQISINIFQAVLGGEVFINTLQGKQSINIPAGAQQGQIIESKNTKKQKHKQSHWAKINIVIPNMISTEQKSIYERLRELQNNNFDY